VRGRIAWIQVTPVKGCAIVERDEVALEEHGVADNRLFYLVDEGGRLVNAKLAPRLLTVRPHYDESSETLTLSLPDEATVAARVELGEAITTSFYGRPVTGSVVTGPWSAALSEVAGRALRLVKAAPGEGVDRGGGRVSLVSTAALERLREAAAADGPVDGRRFRMLFGVDAIDAHEEDGWVGRSVRVGDALVVVHGHVGRCAVTTCNPETGERDLDTLAALADYRGQLEATERLPFGVWGDVLRPGRVRVGDDVVLEG